MRETTKFEEILLLAIWQLDEDAYGVRIRQHLSSVLKRDISYGNLYSVLHQLVKKKYVIKSPDDRKPNHRGRRRLYYTLTTDGLKALKSARELHNNLWANIPKHAFDGHE